MMTQIDELRKMLLEAGIPFENKIRQMDAKTRKHLKPEERYGEAGKWWENQVIYGGRTEIGTRFDAICCFGSYGAKEGLLETYGELGRGENGEPRIMTAREAFEIIKKDWEARCGEKDG